MSWVKCPFNLVFFLDSDTNKNLSSSNFDDRKLSCALVEARVVKVISRIVQLVIPRLSSLLELIHTEKLIHKFKVIC